jgi:hypothetical protein
MFVSFWVGKITSFADGFDEGHDEGVMVGSKATARVVMEYMRDKYDLKVSDPEIRNVIDNISIYFVEKE